ncbi:uncharacterized protein EAF02_006668 [Botrytis sinoallii]|uniref:uncharacterized protein n=1 Tax=Botrytis sinoallii TaxID=1463999 RepID=UPI0019008DF6|nr:uncharacterized protein EAF02_006668 [Botrytis sinoallii]KAF7881980.1 hypothetical protein EAF02_006668 [Botrytis sinoallii]
MSIQTQTIITSTNKAARHLVAARAGKTMDMSMALKESPPSLLDLSQHWPMMESICSGMNFHDIVSLSRTSKRFSSLPETMSKTQLNIDSILQHFVKDPEALRLKMAQTNKRSIRLKDGMCVIVGEEDDEKAFKKFICEEEGYKYLEVEDSSTQIPDTSLTWEWPAVVRDDRDPPASKMYERSFIYRPHAHRVTHAAIPPILAALLCFPDASSANYITCHKAYSMFPNSVLRHKALWLYGPHPGHDQMMPKYVKNGWKLITPSPLEYSRTSSETNTANEKRHYQHFIPDTFRWIGDKHTWTIEHPELPLSLPLDTTRTPKIPDIATELTFVTITTNFRQSYYDFNGPAFYRSESAFYYTTSLKHCYGNTHRNDFAMEKSNFWSHVNNQLFSYSQKQALDKLSLDQSITSPKNK